MSGLLDGKTALITGAASGIGLASVQLFVDEGAAVIGADVDDGGAAAVAAAGGAFRRADVSVESDVRALVHDVVAEYGGLDCALNNAGVAGRLAPLEEYDADDWRQVLDVDLMGVVWCMKYELLHMRERRSGTIVNISSITGATGFPELMPGLVAAKHAVEGLTMNAALTHGANGIRVACVRPGSVATPAFAAAAAQEPGFEDRVAGLHPLNRLARPEEIAQAAAWLCSNRASFVTGCALSVDGGYLTR